MPIDADDGKPVTVPPRQAGCRQPSFCDRIKRCYAAYLGRGECEHFRMAEAAVSIGFYTVTTKEGLVIKMGRCCAKPSPAFRLLAPGLPDRQAPTRKQTIACVRCQAILVELEWPNREPT